ncbi:hypothetical protein GLOIN_2v1780322 [Rhizophagus irregularis DAOM 181602=DAOM 197198]|uniref:F-box domain-containing protein n=1 Tax=Rhizophagus irregularis (strain DAOM 181602 / DAOM 197198 / MUCL 43194) TaxID=747089 RepID=A0A2P4PMR5_RHIID|nr:hypothetical protein GLOIN_2v1780322 [Rhizophagus irregularis DAOM 181602=DAOM 197198]POG66676.1 hypothetical protein GLOIN_2v1780322 [Rhizophagus irregularis DAOM 181602=DAOM 197198]|eukprot:XP_025173542.1 hypothetical protein GLOIN_2v1780322 [Rhizophagus irregularis DAOM 181602=DAOM 197198]
MTELNIDCLNLIFNELRKDKETLYSCLLVNKRWCLLVVPILWEKHTRYIYHEAEKKFHNIILSSLSSSSKQFLGDNRIIIKFFKAKKLKDGKVGICKELGKVLGRKGNTINYLSLYSINIIPLMSLVNLKTLLIYNFELYDSDSIEDLENFIKSIANNCPKLKIYPLDEILNYLIDNLPKSLNKLILSGNWKYSIDILKDFLKVVGIIN